MKVISLDAQIENMIMGAVKKTDGGSYLALEPDVIQNLVSATTDTVNQMRKVVQIPIVLTLSRRTCVF